MASPSDNGRRDAEAAPRSDPAAAEWERFHTSGAPLDLLAQEESRIESLRGGVSAAADRARMTAHREAMAAQRDKVARERDLAADARDRIADARDDEAHARDRAAAVAAGEAATTRDGNGGGQALEASTLAGVAVRRHAATERNAAAADREAAAADRAEAAADRRHAGVDELTDVFRRGAGELALTREIDRARRSGRSLIVALIDVDRLKLVNDLEGHAAGDALLRDVATAITSTMRSYDVTVRWGGDEFVCGLSDATPEVAAQRVEEIRRALAVQRPGASISAGFAELTGDETLDALVARADAALYSSRKLFIRSES